MARNYRQYDGEGRRGYVVESRIAAGAFGDGHPTRELRHYWYGPDHAFGTTWGALGYSVVVFPSRPAAAKAYRTHHGERPGDDVRYRSLADVEAGR